MRVGLLALQGGFAPHREALRALGHDAVPVRAARDLEGVDGLVWPGGESTVQMQLAHRDRTLGSALAAFAGSGRPALATCAGLICVARRVRGPAQASLGWLDVDVRRNARGRQSHSGEAVADDGGLRLVLIRAPRIERVGGGVHVVATLDGEPVLVRQGPIWGATFHPELTESAAVHERVFGVAEGGCF